MILFLSLLNVIKSSPVKHHIVCHLKSITWCVFVILFVICVSKAFKFAPRSTSKFKDKIYEEHVKAAVVNSSKHLRREKIKAVCVFVGCVSVLVCDRENEFGKQSFLKIGEISSAKF